MSDLKTYLHSLLQNVENGIAVTKEHIEEAIQHFDTVVAEDLGIAGVPEAAPADTPVDTTVNGIPGVPVDVGADPTAANAAQS